MALDSLHAKKVPYLNTFNVKTHRQAAREALRDFRDATTRHERHAAMVHLENALTLLREDYVDASDAVTGKNFHLMATLNTNDYEQMRKVSELHQIEHQLIRDALRIDVLRRKIVSRAVINKKDESVETPKIFFRGEAPEATVTASDRDVAIEAK